MSVKRLRKEIKDWEQNGTELGTVWLQGPDGWLPAGEWEPHANGDMFEWQVRLSGPHFTMRMASSPFRGCDLSMSIKFPRDYPFKPPRILFMDPIPYHCAVNAHGAIDLEILHDQWSPALTIAKVLQTVLMVLVEPQSDCALRPEIAGITQGNPLMYEIIASHHTRRSIEYPEQQVESILELEAMLHNWSDSSLDQLQSADVPAVVSSWEVYMPHPFSCLACVYADCDAVEYFLDLENGIPDDRHVFAAVSSANVPVVNLLLSKGVDIASAVLTQDDSFNRRPLHTACATKPVTEASVQLVQMLCAAGADTTLPATAVRPLVQYSDLGSSVGFSDNYYTYRQQESLPLELALRQPHCPLVEQMIEVLLAHGALLDSAVLSEKLVCKLLAEQHESGLKWLTYPGMSVNSHISNGKTLLQVAIKACHNAESPLTEQLHSDAVKQLLRMGADTMQCAENGDGVAQICVEMGGETSIELVKVLLSALIEAHTQATPLDGSVLHFLNGGQLPLLHHVIRYTNHPVELVSLLVTNYGCDTNQLHEAANSSNSSHGTPLHTACDRLPIDMPLVELLITLSAAVDTIQPKNGQTALGLACAHSFSANRPTGMLESQSSVIEILLANGADVNHQDSNSRTPIQLLLSGDAGAGVKAEITGIKDIEASLSTLLSNGAHIQSALLTVCARPPFRGGHTIVELLLSRSADVNGCAGNGQTPLALAAAALEELACTPAACHHLHLGEWQAMALLDSGLVLLPSIGPVPLSSFVMKDAQALLEQKLTNSEVRHGSHLSRGYSIQALLLRILEELSRKHLHRCVPDASCRDALEEFVAALLLTGADLGSVALWESLGSICGTNGVLIGLQVLGRRAYSARPWARCKLQHCRLVAAMAAQTHASLPMLPMSLQLIVEAASSVLPADEQLNDTIRITHLNDPVVGSERTLTTITDLLHHAQQLGSKDSLQTRIDAYLHSRVVQHASENDTFRATMVDSRAGRKLRWDEI